MKKAGIIIFAAALVIGLVVSNIFSFGNTSCKLFNFSVNFKGEKGSGKIVTQQRDVKGFKGVEVGGAILVEITAQKDFSVEIEADDNLISLIKTEVNDGVLEIETEGRISPTEQVKVRISAPDIDNLEVSGASDLTLNNVKNSSLSVDASGASKIKVTGETTKFTLESSGASKINADDLKTVNANIDASGASHIEVYVSGDLSVDASGASHIVYSGKPTVHQKISGASGVTEK
jgi:Putative auto-transporter adhesin, head GIN domain